jgi:hypothetical protein
VVAALVVLLVVGSVGVVGTAFLVRPHRPDEELDDQPRVMSTLPPVPPPARKPAAVVAEPVRPLPPPPRAVRRCGHCRAAGHTRALCPRLTGLQMLPVGADQAAGSTSSVAGPSWSTSRWAEVSAAPMRSVPR